MESSNPHKSSGKEQPIVSELWNKNRLGTSYLYRGLDPRKTNINERARKYENNNFCPTLAIVGVIWRGFRLHTGQPGGDHECEYHRFWLQPGEREDQCARSGQMDLDRSFGAFHYQR